MAKLPTYKAGKKVEPVDGLPAYKLSSNEIAHSPLPSVVAAIADAATEINRYPDREFMSLRGALAQYLGHSLEAENIWAANGSNEVIQQIFQAFGGPGRKAMGFGPTYSMYPIIAQGQDTQYVDAARAERYELDVDTALDGMSANTPDITIVCSPNNPTGTPVSIEVIEAIYNATDGIVLVDEAYAEFAADGTPSALTLLPGRPRLMVSRTMSKAFAFAGARVGYLAADPAVIDALRLVRLPYHLSAFTQAAAEAALAHAPVMLSAVDEIRVQRDRIVAELTGMGLDPYRSDANFVLFGGLEDPAAVWSSLLEDGVLVRNMGIPNTLRVSAGTESETSAFLTSLRKVLHG
jgi:histidinol-phosphate aminotransferase